MKSKFSFFLSILMISLISCQSNSKTAKNFTADPLTLDSHAWALDKWEKDGKDHQNSFMEECFIQFDNNLKQVQGSDGCNNFNGTYQLEGNKVTMGPLASTKKYCGEESAKDEKNFHSLLSAFEITELTAEKLVIKNDSDMLIFKSK